jgi:hypothetical protein
LFQSLLLMTPVTNKNCISDTNINATDYFCFAKPQKCQSRWPRGLICVSAAARLLGLGARMPLGARMSFSSQCCVLSGRGLCVWLITRPEESFRVWCVMNVMVKPRQRRGPGPAGAVASWKNRTDCLVLQMCNDVGISNSCLDLLLDWSVVRQTMAGRQMVMEGNSLDYIWAGLVSAYNVLHNYNYQLKWGWRTSCFFFSLPAVFCIGETD